MFVKTANIHKQLYCTICDNVFTDPVMSDCQHTFCRECLTNWINNAHGIPACPFCRADLPKSDKKLVRNLIANQLIGELEILCPSGRLCSWQGKLDEVKSHLPQCKYKSDKVDEWF